jgi:hypothetical protein
METEGTLMLRQKWCFVFMKYFIIAKIKRGERLALQILFARVIWHAAASGFERLSVTFLIDF